MSTKPKIRRTDRNFAILTVAVFAALMWFSYRMFGILPTLAAAGASFVVVIFRMFRLAFQVAWLRDDYIKCKDEYYSLSRQFFDYRQGSTEILFVTLAEKYPYAFRGPDMIIRFPSGEKIGMVATDFLRYRCINPDPSVGGLDVTTGQKLFEVLQRNVGHQYEDPSAVEP